MKMIPSHGLPGLRSWWLTHGTAALRVSLGLLFTLALMKLGMEFWRLVLDTSQAGAIDLRLFHNLVGAWFAGQRVYDWDSASYPPASYVILWPFVGWLSTAAARWLWAAISLAALVGMSRLILKESGAVTGAEKAFVVLMFLAMNATGVAIGNGQLPILVLLALGSGLLLLRNHPRHWQDECLAVALVLMALVKPSIAAPFFWLVLLWGGVRPAVLLVLSYLAISLWAAAFQEQNLIALLHAWTHVGLRGAAFGAKQSYGSGNLHSSMLSLGLKSWLTHASLLWISALGLWTYRYRHADPWLLLGVTALVARFWTYHGIYDDVLILMPLVALFQLAKKTDAAGDTNLLAGILLAVGMLGTLAPARMLFWPMPWCLPLTIGRALIPFAVLLFLLVKTHRNGGLRAQV